MAADPDKAARFYEDGLSRYTREDLNGAIIQLKNALQQDNKLLAAHVLLGNALLRTGDVLAAEVAFSEALRLGVSRSEVAVPLAKALLLMGQTRALLDRVSPEGLPVPAQIEVLSLRGAAHFELGELAQSTASFERARQLDPQSPIPLVAEAPILLARGQLVQARALIDKAVQLAPKNADAWYLQGSVTHISGDLKQALEYYGKALGANPKHVDARLARVAVHLEQQRDAEAEKDLEILHQQVPAEARANYLRAVLAGRKGNSAEVARSLGEVAKIVDAMPRAWINNQEQFLMLGATAHHGLGNFTAARAYLDTIIGRNGRHVAARKLLASIYFDQGDLASASNTLDQALRDAPGDGQALFLKGRILMAEKRYVQATDYLERAAKAGLDTAEVRAALGQGLLNLGKGEQGLKSLEEAFRRKPGDAAIGLMLASLHMRMGQSAKAIEVVDSMLKRDPNNLAALNLMGVVKGAAGDRIGARKAYEQALAREPKFSTVTLNLARLDQAEGKQAEARKRLDALVAAEPQNALAQYELALLEQRMGRTQEAQRRLQKVVDEQPRDVTAGVALIDILVAQRAYESAIKQARELAARAPDNLDALAALARAQIAAGDNKGAIQSMKDMTRLAEFNPVLQVRIGRMQLMVNNFDGAAYNAQKALAVAPSDLAALSLQADVELSRRDIGKAEALARELQARYPASAEGWRVSGDAASARGQHQAAAVAYRSALERDPTTVNVQRVAHAWLLAGDTRQAQANLETWLAKRPGDVAVRAALAETQMRDGNWSAARNQYQQVLKVDPNNPVALNNLANILIRLKDAQATSVAERAWKLAPENPDAIDTYGWALASAGDYERALRLLRDARLRLPQNPDVRHHLAYTLARLGRKEEARAELQPMVQAQAKFEAPESVAALRKELGM